MFGFENELEFDRNMTSEPDIKIIDFESDSQIEGKFCSEEKLVIMRAAPEIRCDAIGRKEDSADGRLGQALEGSCWYTDVDSGISAGRHG